MGNTYELPREKFLNENFKSSQVANFQIGTNKCAMQRAQHSKKKERRKRRAY